MTWLLLAALVVTAVFWLQPRSWDSRLVRVGAYVLLFTSVTMALVPGLGTGLLFLVSAPLALLLIAIGTIRQVTNRHKGLNDDIAALAVAARGTARLWPGDAPLPQVEGVAKHGLRAAPALVSLLRFESEAQLTDGTWSPGLEQQVELALCKIYGELPSAARTVYDVQATPEENRQVKQFWEAHLRSPQR
jgi:hypothetical protein